MICLNVLEHVDDHERALRNIYKALVPGGKAIILVPQGEWLFSSLDEAVEHFRRYTKASLAEVLVTSGFEVLSVRDYNAVSVPGWFVNGKLLKRRHLSRSQLKIFNTLTPIFRAVDPHLPWHGLSVVAVGHRH